MSDSPPPYLRLFVDKPPWYQPSGSTALSDEEQQVLRLKIRLRVLERLVEETKEHIRDLGSEIGEVPQPVAGRSVRL